VVRRLMSDNHWSYVRNRSLRELLAAEGIRHILLEPRRPRPTARWSVTSRRSSASGASASATAHPSTAAVPCHTGCATTDESQVVWTRGTSFENIRPGAGEPALKRRIWGIFLPRCCRFAKKMT
jgi:hypothetical protein